MKLFSRLRRQKDRGSVMEAMAGLAVGVIVVGAPVLYFVNANGNAQDASTLEAKSSSITEVLNRASTDVQTADVILKAADNEIITENSLEGVDKEDTRTRWVKSGKTLYQQVWTGYTGDYDFSRNPWIPVANEGGSVTAANGGGTQFTRKAVQDVEQTTPVFKYWDKKDNPVSVNPALTAASGGTDPISRVETSLKAGVAKKADGSVQTVANTVSAAVRGSLGGSASSTITAPTCPSVTAVRDTTTGKVTVNWGGVSGITLFDVYRNSSKMTSVTTASGGGSNWTDTTAAPGSTNGYGVRAIDSLGQVSAYCEAVVTTTGLAKPALHSVSVNVPEITAAGWTASTLTRPQVVLNWKTIAGASKYVLSYRETDPVTFAATTNWTDATTIDAPGLTYTWNNGVWGKRYEWKVTARAESGVFNESASVATLMHPPAPDVTSVVAQYGTDTTGKNVVTWSAVPTATKYDVWRYNSGSTGAVTHKKTVNAPAVTWTDPDPAYGSTYTYYVTAQNNGPRGVNASGAIVTQARSSATPESVANDRPVKMSRLQYPATPVSIAVSATGSRDYDGYNRLKWNAVPTATGYDVERYGAKDLKATCLTTDCKASGGGVTGTSYDDTVAKGTQHLYAVRAYNATGVSKSFSVQRALTQRPAPPTLTVTNPTLTTDDATLKITQNADKGNTTANRFCTKATCEYKFIQTSSTIATLDHSATDGVLSYTDGNKPGNTYNYYAQSKNAAITSDGWSDKAHKVVNTYPGKIVPKKWFGNKDKKYVKRNMITLLNIDDNKEVEIGPGFTSIQYEDVAGATSVTTTRTTVTSGDRYNTKTALKLPTKETITTTVNSGDGKTHDEYAYPDTTYKYTIVAKAANGLTREYVTGTMTTAPEVPRHAKLQIVCAGNNLKEKQYVASRIIDMNEGTGPNFKPRFGGFESVKLRGIHSTSGGSQKGAGSFTLEGTDYQATFKTSAKDLTSQRIQNLADWDAVGFDTTTLSNDAGASDSYPLRLYIQLAGYFDGCAGVTATGKDMKEPPNACYGYTPQKGCPPEKEIPNNRPRWTSDY